MPHQPEPAGAVALKPAAQPPAFLPNLCNGPALLRLVLLAESLALVLELARTGLQLDWVALAMTSLMVQWITLASAALICRLSGWLAARPLWAALCSCFGLILAMTLVLSLAGQWFYRGYWWTGEPLQWHALGTDLVLAAIFAGIGLQYFFLLEQLRRQSQAELKARIQALQSRIRPHFLFNAMNSIASLIVVDAARAEKMVEDLAALFRASLSEAALVPVADELALARRYLDMEAARLGDRLQLRWQLGELPSHALIPGLLIQPLLENALYHGIGDRRAGGLLEIELGCANNRLQLMVRNPLGEGDRQPGNGLALDNIRERLAVHFGPAARCQAGVEADHFVVRIEYPLPPE